MLDSIIYELKIICLIKNEFSVIRIFILKMDIKAFIVAPYLGNQAGNPSFVGVVSLLMRRFRESSALWCPFKTKLIPSYCVSKAFNAFGHIPKMCCNIDIVGLPNTSAYLNSIHRADHTCADFGCL